MRWYFFLLIAVVLSATAMAQEDLSFTILEQNRLLSVQEVTGNLFLCGEDEPGIDSTLHGLPSDVKIFHQYDIDRDCYWQYSALDLTCDTQVCSFRSSQPVVTPYRVVVFVPELSRLFISDEASFSTHGTYRLSLQNDGTASLSSTATFFEREEWIWFVRLIPICLLLELILTSVFARFYRLSVNVVRTILLLDILLLSGLWVLGFLMYSRTSVLWSYVLIAVVARFFITKEMLYLVHKDIFVRQGTLALTLLTQVTSLIVGVVIVSLF